MMRALSHSFARFFSSISLLPYATAVLLTVSFPRLDLWFLAWISLVPLMFSLDGKSRAESFRFSYFCGVLFFGATLFWLCFVTRLGTVLFVAYLALYFGLFGLGYYYFSRTKFLVRLFLLPALWVALEYTRAHFLTGFGWVCLGHTQYQNLWLIQIADIVGVYGLSFLVVMVNVVFKEAVTYGKERQRPTKEFLAGGAIAIFLIAASVVYSAGQLDRKFEGPPVKIGLVQGNVPHERRWHSKAWPFILRDHTDLSQQLAHEGVDLIVWPESAYPGYCWEDPELFAHLQESIRRQRTAHLIGVVTKEKEDYFNSALSFDKDGVVVQRYHKIRLVPFGEFIPLRKQLPFLSALVPIDDFTPGQEFVLFNVPHWQSAKEYFYSTLICFEDTLPDIARGFVKRGAHLLINISNDAWFEDTCEPFVHLQNAVFRSVENRRWLVRCGNVGVSCFVDPWGRIMAAAADKSGKRTYVESTSVATAVLLESQTLYTKFGDWFAYFCISGILVGAIALKVQNQKKPNA